MDQIKLQPTIKIVSTICPYLNIMDFIKIKSCIMHKITAQGKTDWVIVTWRVENNDVKTKEKNMPGNLLEYKMTTNTNCPSCDNEDVYLVHCHKSVWKVCEKCKKGI